MGTFFELTPEAWDEDAEGKGRSRLLRMREIVAHYPREGIDM